MDLDRFQKLSVPLSSLASTLPWVPITLITLGSIAQITTAHVQYNQIIHTHDSFHFQQALPTCQQHTYNSIIQTCMTLKDLTSKDPTTSHHIEIGTISYTPHSHFFYALELRNQSKPTTSDEYITKS
jgi:hypothetical protein